MLGNHDDVTDSRPVTVELKFPRALLPSSFKSQVGFLGQSRDFDSDVPALSFHLSCSSYMYFMSAVRAQSLAIRARGCQ